MTGILTLHPNTTPLSTLRTHWRFALARLKTDANAAAYVADFTAFGPQWDAADTKEQQLDDAVTDAEAAVIAADAAIDDLVDQVATTIHGNHKADVEAPLHQLYFGNLTPSEIRRPILGTQLDKVQGWPGLLSQAKQVGLQQLATPMDAAVKAGNTAAKALADALTARSAFRLGGDRQQAFDTFNAICAKAYGGLKAYAHDHPELKRRGGYAESFFKGSDRPPQGHTVPETEAAATKAQAKAAKAAAAHDEAVKKAAAKDAAAKDRQAKEDAVKAAKKAVGDAKKKAKEAEAAAKKK